jgi:hypothetical protein
MKNHQIKIKLQLVSTMTGTPVYRVASLTNSLSVHTSKGNFRVGDCMEEESARELINNHRDHVVTITPFK